MKHAMSAAVALAVGLGMTAAAQANDTAQHNTLTHPMLQRAAAAQPMDASQPRHPLARRDIRQAQQQLRSEGLYKGPINGTLGRSTRVAIGRFQQRNGLPRTARLDSATHDRLMGGRGVGIGSSTPNPNPMSNPTNGNNAAPLMPPVTQAPGAGGNNSAPNTMTTPSATR